MRVKVLVGVLVGAVAMSLLLAAPAHAANRLTVKKIATKTAPYKKSVTVKPSASASGNVKITDKRISVKRKGKYLARNKRSTKLKAGRYKVTSTVKYQTWKVVQERQLRIRSGAVMREYGYDSLPGYENCSVTSVEYNDEYYGGDDRFTFRCDVRKATVSRMTFHSDDIVGGHSAYNAQVGDHVWPDGVRVSQDVYGYKNVRQYSATKSKKRTQTLRIKQGRKPAACATYSGYREVKNGMTTKQVKLRLGPSKVWFSSGGIVGREYKPCDGVSSFDVSFEDGRVYDKSYVDLNF